MTTIPLCSYAICAIVGWVYFDYQVVFWLLFVAIILDLLSWFLKFFALKKVLTRSLAVWVAIKLILYIMIPAMAKVFVVDYLKIDGWIVDSWLSALFSIFIVAEVISITQNFIIARTKDVSYTETDAITTVLSIAKKALNVLFDKLVALLMQRTEEKK
jgi:phage-related holin